MGSRMDRYQTKNSNNVQSRTLRNQKVYEELYTNSTYTNFSRVDAHAIDLSELDNTNMGRRESYHKTKGAQSFGMEDTTKVKDYNYSYPNTEKETPKDFDINHVLQEAKKNREDSDEDLEKKRKLKTTEYNILTDLTQAKMKELKKKADMSDVLSNEEEEKLENLINTITSKTMTHDINQILEQEKIKKQEQEGQKDSLLDDLMPTNIDETLISSDILNQVQEKTVGTKEQTDTDMTRTEVKTIIDESFYTKSMDLSKDDLVHTEDDLEDDELFIEEPSKKSRIFMILVFAIVIFLIIGIIFVLYQYLH